MMATEAERKKAKASLANMQLFVGKDFRRRMERTDALIGTATAEGVRQEMLMQAIAKKFKMKKDYK